MRVRVLLLLSFIALIGCGGRENKMTVRAGRVVPENEKKKSENDFVRLDAGYFMKKSLLGSKLGTDGNVAEEKTTFVKGEPVYLTLILHDSPAGLQTHVTWLRESDKRELHSEFHNMNGAKSITFALADPKLEPGYYRVIAYWGGNVAADKPFEIVRK